MTHDYDWSVPQVRGFRLRKLIAYFTALAILFCNNRITEDEFVKYAKEFAQAL